MPWFLIEPFGYRYPISENEDEGLSIGRTPDNDVILQDLEVSRHHAFIKVRGQEAWLYDRDSANGTWLNGVRISSPQSLHAGDEIRVGEVVLRMLYTEPEVIEPPISHSGDFVESNSKQTVIQYSLLGALLGLVGLAIVGLFIFGAVGKHKAAAPVASPYASYADAIRATVFVLTPVGDTPNGRAGTGVVITSKGRILTAYSLVINPGTGRSYNRNNRVMVAVLRNELPASGRMDWYLAHVVRADRQRDVAVLQIYALENGATLPNSFRLHTIPIGNSDELRVDDAIALISFPAGGENSGASLGKALALGQGHALSFLPDPNIQVDRGWIATDMALSQNNIGAPVLDGDGRIVGIYPGEDAAQKSGSANSVRPVNLARPLWVTGP
ncbi:MAG: hypothetical protein DSY55_04920 [Clostridia bacterium]|nr:MAG: hypothetical protein DSY55_04920 [Clostridia bacterium]